jgi:co-chaperonin GroES (HSP10)
MKFKPAQGLVAVRLNTTKQTASGIVIPDNAITERVVKATVIGAGRVFLPTLAYDRPNHYKEGQIVAFLKGNGIPIKDDEGDIIVLREDEIIGVFYDSTESDK